MTNRTLISLPCVLALVSSCLAHQDTQQELEIGEPKRVQTGFSFTEGPASDDMGNVYFTDIPNEKIHIHRIDGTLDTFMESSAKCNGLMFDPNGDLWACQGDEGRIIRIDLTTKKIEPVAAEFGGGPFLSTNDLVLDAHGGAYFTDPAYWRHPDAKVDEGVYYVNAQGKITRLFEGLPRPNGILLSPDGSTLYLLPAGMKRLLHSEVSGPGKVTPLKELAELPSGGDGLTCDTDGNLYLTQPRKKSVLVVTPAGKIVQTIKFPERPSNIAFGGPDLGTLYVTAQTSLYELPVNRRGIRVQSTDHTMDGDPKTTK